MRSYIVVSIGLMAACAAPALSQTSIDSQAWLTAPASEDGGASVRWRLTTETATPAPVVLPSGLNEDRDITTIASQFDFYPFGQDFYLSAGTVSGRERGLPSIWTAESTSDAVSAFPHAELTEDLDQNRLDSLTRYFGAGVTVRTIDDWSVTVEGGAYFQDRAQDQLVMFDPETGEHMRLLEDLDRVDAEAIGESQSRSVRPVGHLVLRRRF